ncbi:tRNA (mnm(5)s(2)U34)-methyltransferase [Selenomonas ruminantium]|uniref:Putative rRNA methylase n=1 Tax=Selenomonas ruminantium TaxID=971 RepID=A0A1H0RVS3_SELRU|nr:class I SAM-dependent methyltransferase [Selenomonas ruminantium]SDP33672.1 Putative rRNA methylase [Selenomonas ruminantium]
MQTVSNVINLVQQSILPALAGANVIVDATAGNGNDTLFLAEHGPDQAKIYAFDIQQAALEHTRLKTAAYASRIEYILASHAEIDKQVPGNIDVAMFNLGYLPGEEHKVTTVKESTRMAVEQVLDKLSINGICIIVAYPGHEAGAQEAVMLEEFLGNLPRRDYTVGCYRLLNHRQTAPYAYMVERVR